MGAMKELVSHAEKDKLVKQLIGKTQKSNTVMLVSIKGLPSRQFQEIKKKLRAHAEVRVAKKNIILRVIKGYGKESLLQLEPYVKENCALIFSDSDGFELAGILAQNKNPIFAKAGQIAPEDIEVKAGPTELVPGPAISELGALGIQISVEDGKLSIKQSKIVVKKDVEIKASVASLLQKLKIQPFKIGLDPVALYDIKNEKIYTEIKIDSEEARKSLLSAAGKALGFAQKIVYYCRETIGYLLAKANAEAKALSKHNKHETKESENVQLNNPEESQ